MLVFVNLEGSSYRYVDGHGWCMVYYAQVAIERV